MVAKERQNMDLHLEGTRATSGGCIQETSHATLAGA